MWAAEPILVVTDDNCAATGLFQRFVLLELIDYSDEVDGLLGGTEGLDGLVDKAVGRFIEHLGTEGVAHRGVCILGNEERTQHGGLGGDVARRLEPGNVKCGGAVVFLAWSIRTFLFHVLFQSEIVAETYLD